MSKLEKLELIKNEQLLTKLKTYYPYEIFDSEESVRSCLMAVIENNKEMFTQTIKKVRVNLGLSQKQLAEAMGVTLMTYSSWERGVNSPRKKVLIDALEQNQSNIRPEELITENPKRPNSIISKDVPLLTPKSFYGKDLETLMYLLRSQNDFEKYPVCFNEDCDFAIRISDDDMIGGGKYIPKNSIALCSCSELIGKNFFEKLEYINGKVAVVGILHGSAIVRESNFIDKKFLQLKAWNSDIEEKKFPVEFLEKPAETEAEAEADQRTSKMHNIDTLAINVAIFGVVNKVIIDLQ